MQPTIEATTQQGEVSLRREINLLHSVSIVIGSIIGSGIFVSPSIVLLYSGSVGLSLALWAVGGIISIAGGLCYCELGTLIQNSGGDYAYIREAFSFKNKKPWMTHVGSLLAFLLLWTSLIVIRAASLAIVPLTFSQYLLAPFFINCLNVPTTPVKLITIATLSKELCSFILSLAWLHTEWLNSLLLSIDSCNQLLQCESHCLYASGVLCSKDFGLCLHNCCRHMAGCNTR